MKDARLKDWKHKNEFGLSELKQTRFYQEAKEEGKEEGRRTRNRIR
jgi:predicted transposase YdaD